MPNSKSAAKRVRQDAEKKQKNMSRKTTIKTALKKLDTLIEQENAEQAREQMNVVFRALDKAVKRNIIHKNKAARKKSQISKKVHSLAAKG